MFSKNVRAFVAVYANNNSAFIPEMWANESIALLIEKMVIAQLVNRDFEEAFARFGDVAHTRKPADFEAYRKTSADDVTVQDTSAAEVLIPLDQHIHVSFMVKDEDDTKSFEDLVRIYLEPAMTAMARMIDRVCLGQVYQFFASQYSAGPLSTTNAVQAITGVREKLNANLAPDDTRRLILGTHSESVILQNRTFHEADKVGDEGTALRNASLGHKFGFDTFLSQNMASVSADNSAGVGAINAGNLTAGSTTLTVNGFGSGEVVPGDWIMLGGYFYHVTATDNATATSLTIAPPLFADTTTSAVITVGKRASVNQAVSPTGYAAGYSKAIVYNSLESGGNVAVGRMVTFGTQNTMYTIVRVTATTITHDRPLETAIANSDLIHLGPTGYFNFAFHRNCMTLVIRPLKPPTVSAIATNVNFNGCSMRVVITYDGTKQGHLVTCDFLAGVKVLDVALGAIMNA